jgi:4-hydroxybenzoate polyprenyltransferase
LVAIVSNLPGCCDIDFDGLSFTFFMLATSCDPLGHDPHVDHRLPFPSSWLQLLATLLVIMISMVCLTSLVFGVALIFLIVILIFVVLVVITSNAPGCGLGCATSDLPSCGFGYS